MRVGDGFKDATVVTRKSYTREMRRIEKKFNRVGAKMHVLMGFIYDAAGSASDGLSDLTNGVSFVMANSLKRTFLQVGKHEALHHYIVKDETLRNSLWAEVLRVSGFSEFALDALVQQNYKAEYAGAYGPMNEENKWKYRAELLCDLYGKIDDRPGLPAKSFENISNVVNKTVDKWEKDWHRFPRTTG